MTQDGNAYHGLAPEMKLKQFLFEAERFITSIIGYCKLLTLDSEKPELQNALSAEFPQYLDSIQETGWKFAKLIQEINDPGEENSYRAILASDTLAVVLLESGRLIPVITGYSALLEIEAQKADFEPYPSSKFRDNLAMMHTAVTRLAKTRGELFESMKSAPPNV